MQSKTSTIRTKGQSSAPIEADRLQARTDIVLPELLDYSELARITRKSIGTLRRYKLLGLGPRYLRIGRHVRFRREDVVDWLDSCACRGNTAHNSRVL